MVLCILPNGEDFSRAGFSASRRLGNAVQRNLARRRMSEAVRLAWDLILPGYDMVWVGRAGVNQADFSQVQEACVQLLRRAHLLRIEQ